MSRERIKGARGAGNGKPLCIRRSRTCYDAEGGAVDERFKFRHPQSDFGSFLEQYGQPRIAKAHSRHGQISQTHFQGDMLLSAASIIVA